jgi:hypothetical protein
MGDSSGVPAPADPGDPGSVHEQFTGAAAGRTATTERQLGVDATSPISAVAVEMDLADDLGQERMPDRPRRWWPIVGGLEPVNQSLFWRIGDRSTV